VAGANGLPEPCGGGSRDRGTDCRIFWPPRTAAVSAGASVRQDPGGFILTLTVRDAEAERSRQLGAPTCEELGHAAALIIALAVDPTIIERRVDLEPPTPYPTESSPAQRQRHCRLIDLPVLHQAASGPSAIEPLFWRLGLGTFVSTGLLPGFFPGFGVLGAFQSRTLRLELAVSMLLSRVDDPSSGRGASFSLYRAAPRFCFVRAKKGVGAGPCGGIELGRISGQGFGAVSASEDSALWVASTLGAIVEWRLGSSTLLSVTGDLGIPWRRDQFTWNDVQLHRPSAVSGTLGLNLAAGWQ
jgi:hypothetical protein